METDKPVAAQQTDRGYRTEWCSMGDRTSYRINGKETQTPLVRKIIHKEAATKSSNSGQARIQGRIERETPPEPLFRRYKGGKRLPAYRHLGPSLGVWEPGLPIKTMKRKSIFPSSLMIITQAY